MFRLYSKMNLLYISASFPYRPLQSIEWSSLCFTEGSSVQLLSRVRLFATPMNRSTPGLPVHHQLPSKLMSIESVMPSSHLILCCPLLSSYLQSFPASGYFPMSLFFASGGQSIGASALTSLLSMNIQYFPASGSFPMSLFFTSSGQSIGVSASASVFPKNTQN